MGEQMNKWMKFYGHVLWSPSQLLTLSSAFLPLLVKSTKTTATHLQCVLSGSQRIQQDKSGDLRTTQLWLPPAHLRLLAQDVETAEKVCRSSSESEGMEERERAVLDTTCHQFLLTKVILGLLILRHSDRDLNSASAVLSFVDRDLKASCPLDDPRVSDFKFLTRWCWEMWAGRAEGSWR